MLIAIAVLYLLYLGGPRWLINGLVAVDSLLLFPLMLVRLRSEFAEVRRQWSELFRKWRGP